MNTLIYIVRRAALVLVTITIPVMMFETISDNRLVFARGDVRISKASDLPPPRAGYDQLRQEYTALFSQTRTLPIHVALDQFGMRYDSTDRTIDQQKPSIVIMGDSFSWGAENDCPDTLEPRIAAAFPDFNTLNFLRAGMSSFEYPDIFDTFKLAVSPPGVGLVILGIYTDMTVGDIPRVLARERYGPRVTFLGIDVGQDRAERLKQSRLLAASFKATVWLREHSSTFNTLVPPAPSRGFAINIMKEIEQHNPDRLSNDLVARTRKVAVSAGISPSCTLVWLIPSNKQFQARYFARLGGTEPPPHVRDVDAFWFLARKRLEADGFRVVDMQYMADEVFASTGEYIFTASGHFMPRAYEFAAQRLLPHIQEMGDCLTH